MTKKITKPKMPRIASRIWDEVTAEREFGASQRTLLSDYCRCLGKVEELEERAAKEGVFVKGERGGKRKNPTFQILREYRTAAQQYARILGLAQPAKVTERKQPGEALLDGNWKTPPTPKGVSVH